MFKKWIVLILAIILTTSFASAGSASPQKDRPNGITWPVNQELPSFAKATHLDVIDMGKQKLSGDMRMMLVTLQGLVNRERPSIYVIEDQETVVTWLKTLNLPTKMYEDPWKLLDKYIHRINGIIIYDPKVQDSINVATTLAGLRSGIVVSPELAESIQLRYKKKIKVIDDLRGRFKDRLDAYTWQYENLWPYTTHRMLIGITPSVKVNISTSIPEQFKTVIEELQPIKNSSNRKVYDLDLSTYVPGGDIYLRFDDSFEEDGWGPAVHQVTVKADDTVIDTFVPGQEAEAKYLYDRQNSVVGDGYEGHRYADQDRYWVYKFTPPAGSTKYTVSVDMWNEFKVSATNEAPRAWEDADRKSYGMLRDYAVANKAMVFWLDATNEQEKQLFEKIIKDCEPGTPYLGWFDHDVEGEFKSTQMLSQNSIYVLAADFFSNLTVFSGTRAPVMKQKPAPKVPLQNKIYVTYNMGEGDNLQYNQHRLRQAWDDPNRGKVPINWTISPLLLDAAPAILGYYQKTASVNDLLIAGPSGVGYFYPGQWPDQTFRSFMKQSKSYMERGDFGVTYILNLDNNPLTDFKAQAYTDYFKPQGIMMMLNDKSNISFLNGKTPQSILRPVGTKKELLDKLKQEKDSWDGKSPKFVSLAVMAWTFTPSDLLEVTQQLGPEYEVVRADQYFQLIQETK